MGMSDVEKNETKLGGYVLVALIAAAVVHFWVDQTKAIPPVPLVSTSPPPIAATTEATFAPPQPPLPVMATMPPPKPEHSYVSVEGTTYYYSAAVSDEQSKTGKRAPDMLAFWYLGRDSKGQDLILNIENGTGQGLSSCLRPCKAIHYSNGQTVGFDPDSVIGAAFADAQHGFMKKHIYPKQKVEPEPDYPWPNDPAVPAPATPNQ